MILFSVDRANETLTNSHGDVEAGGGIRRSSCRFLVQRSLMEVPVPTKGALAGRDFTLLNAHQDHFEGSTAVERAVKSDLAWLERHQASDSHRPLRGHGHDGA